MTLSNHYPYLWDWGIEFPQNLLLTSNLNGDEDNIYPAYRRGIHYTDKALGQFLERFENSKLADNTLLIITGDHGIWTFPDQLLNQDDLEGELRRNEIYFRLPLLIHAPDLPAETRTQPASQLDIAPTVLDYLGIEIANAFIGKSLLQTDSENTNPVYFMAAGGYGVRNSNQYCYPVDTTDSCSSVKKYRSCSAVTGDANTVCVESNQDLILPEVKFELSNSDQTDQKTLIDLTQHLLRHEYLPREELLQ
jgi:phosphoglycerol transferase MdoB-like AlkP superfamily enzyme